MYSTFQSPVFGVKNSPLIPAGDKFRGGEFLSSFGGGDL